MSFESDCGSNFIDSVILFENYQANAVRLVRLSLGCSFKAEPDLVCFDLVILIRLNLLRTKSEKLSIFDYFGDKILA